MASRWSEESTIKFVEAYRDRECLWNSNSAIYKNKQARQTAYEGIKNIMNIDGFGVAEVKNKIRILRSTYSQEKKKIRDSITTEASEDDIYVPQVKWFRVMDKFLQSIEDNKRAAQEDLCAQDEITCQISDNTDIKNFDMKQNPGSSYRTRAARSRKRSKIQRVTNIVSELKTIPEVSQQLTENEFQIFGRSVTAQLISLSKYNAIQAQGEIQSILTSYRLQEARNELGVCSPDPPEDGVNL